MIDSWPLASGQNAVCSLPYSDSTCESVWRRFSPAEIWTHSYFNTRRNKQTAVTLTAAQIWNFLMPDLRRQTDVLLLLFFFWPCESKQFVSCIVLFPVGSALILRSRLYIQRIWFIHVAGECGGESQHNTFTFRQRLSVSRAFQGRTDVWFTAVWKEPSSSLTVWCLIIYSDADEFLAQTFMFFIDLNCVSNCQLHFWYVDPHNNMNTYLIHTQMCTKMDLAAEAWWAVNRRLWVQVPE